MKESNAPFLPLTNGNLKFVFLMVETSRYNESTRKIWNVPSLLDGLL